MYKRSQAFKLAFWIGAAAVFIIVVLRCILVPFSHDEVATFLFYIQPEKFIPFYAHPDANGHFLTNLTSWFCFKLFGSSPGALRIPDMLAFIVLALGTYRIASLFKKESVAIFFSSALLLSYNFVAYFALCRGYGLSMAFLVIATYHFLLLLKDNGRFNLWLFSLFSQLALSANLTLVAVLGVLTGLLVLKQFSDKKLFSVANLFFYLIQFSLLYYWVRYGLYLKEAGALYYGGGESYWKVTFISLIETLLLKSTFLNYFVLALFGVMSFYFIFEFIKGKLIWLKTNLFAVSYLSLLLLITGFFVLKIIAGINYPEDRTGLFFYLFFLLSLSFMLDQLSPVFSQLSWLLTAFFPIQFFSLLNFQVHASRLYETMPQRFYDRLVEEQAHADHPITIGGHRVREFFYGFLNYNSPIKLNHMTAPEALEMNCDYALAYEQDKPYYQNFYEEIDTEPYFGYRLIRRKKALMREQLFEEKNYAEINGSFLYSNLLKN